jgi:hypothetical protein
MGKPLSRTMMKNRTAGWRYPSSGELHAAFDYSVPIGTPIFAVRGGKILKVVDKIKNLEPDEDGKSGDPPNFIAQRIKYKGARATVFYVHISKRAFVDELDEVEEGELIALSGHNGHSEGPHLHISAVIGDSTRPFRELDGLPKATAVQPTDGVASNGITIYPPSLAYGSQDFNQLDAGDIVLEELTFGIRNSDTVRRLQHRLNGIHLQGGAELRPSGNFTSRTRDEVIKWQVQKRHAVPGSIEAGGNVIPEQATALFRGPRFHLVHQP